MRRWTGPRRDESGVMAVFIALVTCFTLVPLAAYAVDIGVQRVATRDMQALADVVALDLARELDGRKYSQIVGSLQALADTSAARNSGVGDSRTVAPELGTIDESRYSATDPEAIFIPVTSDADGIPNAVRVTASTSVSFSIHGGSGGATRTAIARSDATACFRLGSWAARLDSNTSALLNRLIGDALHLGAVDYRGLAVSSITVGELAAELRAGTPDQLVALDNVSLSDLFSAAANVLQSDGGNSANVSLLRSLAGAGFSGVTRTHIAMSDLFDIATGSGSAFATSVNLYDLVAATAFVANGDSLLDVPSFNAGLPWLAPNLVNGKLKVIQAPILTCGHIGAHGDTSQIDLQLTVDLPSTTIPLVATTASRVTITATVARAAGTLSAINCKVGYPKGIDVDVTTGLADVTAKLHVDVRSLLGVLATVDTMSGGSVNGTSSTVSIRVPPDSYDSPKETGTGVLEAHIGSITSADVHLEGLSLGLVSTVVAALNADVIGGYVNPLLDNLNTYSLTPLTGALGLRIAGADVLLPKPPSCGDVSLVG